jgi:uroporphyrinogen decarboxylase
MREFVPDYKNVINAARNVKPVRLPLYEHIISDRIMEKILNRKFAELINGDLSEKREYFSNYISFFKEMGYDTVSFECCIGGAMPGSGALGGHKPGVIKTREDFEKYPWNEIHDRYFKYYSEYFTLLGEEMPAGMKAIGGVGNGVFECVQDVVGYMDLCYMSYDDPELYKDMFRAVGKVMHEIWSTFLKRYGDIYAVCRFGDDLGYKSQTLIPEEDIKNNIIPEYKKVVQLIHSHNKPFLLHSCGNIFGIMEDLVEVAGIDAKHSNEDVIAPFSTWVERYGDRIGNFGGVDTDVLCQRSEKEIKEYVKDVIAYSREHGGIAIGSGNSIPDYVPVNGYLAMIETVREYRGER